MSRYIPAKRPRPQQWPALSEEKRITLVEKAHADVELEESAKRIHAALHVVVENQLAMDVADVVETFERLRKEGLDRHQRIHAVGTVLVEYICEPGAPGDGEYFAALKRLTAKGWIESYDEI